MAKTSVRVQVGAVQVHPVPAMDTRVNPIGAVSVTVTSPVVGPAAAPLETVTVYVAFCWPWAKFPTCDLVMASAAAVVVMTVESVVFAVADPPPETATAFTCGEVAAAATFTVTVIVG